MGSKINILLLVIIMFAFSSISITPCDLVRYQIRIAILIFLKEKLKTNLRFNFIKPNKDYSLGGLIGLTNKSLNPSNVVLDSFVKLHNTISFLIIRNDTILYEKYNGKYTDSSLVSSFSMVNDINTDRNSG
jgi:hypothetical protein